MSARLYEFTDTNFKQEVLQSDLPVLVDFWAAWCGPCRRVGPAIENLATKYDKAVKVGKLNVDDHAETALRFGITSIPAVLVFKDGEVIETLVGVRPLERCEQALELVMTPA